MADDYRKSGQSFHGVSKDQYESEMHTQKQLDIADTLIKRQEELQTNFDTMKDRIKSMDIELGKVKVKFGGSSAGHNGIESIDKNIGKNYSRIRIGIGRPKNNSTGADHVLDNFSVEEKQSIETVTNNIIYSIANLIKKDLDLFSSQVNQK